MRRGIGQLSTGERIRVLRERKGWRQKDLIREAGLDFSQAVLSHLENDKYIWGRQAALRAIEEALGAPNGCLDAEDTDDVIMAVLERLGRIEDAVGGLPDLLKEDNQHHDGPCPERDKGLQSPASTAGEWRHEGSRVPFE